MVDDETYLLPALARLLDRDFDVLTASSAEAAVAILQRRPADIVLTDQQMAGQTGVQLLEWVREHFPGTVRLLMTGYADMGAAIDAINRGHIYYYLNTPWRDEEVRSVLTNAARMLTLERRQEGLVEQLRRMNEELDRRVSERTRELEDANRALRQLALKDPLTGLFNRRAMEQLADLEVRLHTRYDTPLAIGLVDLDHFQRVIDVHLHTGGDKVLKGVAQVLTGSVRDVDSVGRVGREEFLIIARETNERGAAALAERIRATVERTPIDCDGKALDVTVSIGFAVAEPGVPAAYPALTRAAAAALNFVKAHGRNGCEVRGLRASA